VRLDANLALLFRDRPLLERFAAAKRAGFDAVEFWDCEGATARDVAAAVAAAGVSVISCNAPAGDLVTGGLGLSGVPGRERDFEAAIAIVAEVAQAAGCPNVHISPCRLAPGASRAAALATLERNLAFAADTLGRIGIRTLIEPISPADIPGVLLGSLAAVLEVIERVAHPNAYVLFDFYHVSQTDAAPLALLRSCYARIGHVQIADFPGRGAPGTGRLDFGGFLGALASLGYAGWIGAEYRPALPEHSQHAWLRQVLFASAQVGAPGAASRRASPAET
jgi:hydroxypyruvate isomerase